MVMIDFSEADGEDVVERYVLVSGKGGKRLLCRCRLLSLWRFRL
jgi:hypothetical protein